ncbi:hypothetical protein HNY73_011502 [Argiope bruennichi]|uniref:Uncharacterized protein n=1 Tax=Argiope bruennichi TaxID=94029 RepID=A0A8T0F703_ARGBR|nr:hypothetical protein HNY73_011502 [Argiope bruennichi]
MTCLERGSKMIPLHMKRIIMSVFISFLLYPTYFTLDDEDFHTFIAKTIMEDPWLSVSISEENAVTLTNAPSTTQTDAQTENYSSLDIETSTGESWSNEDSLDSSVGPFQKYSIIILQNNCSDIKEQHLNVQRINVFNNTYLKGAIEDCRNFVSVKVSGKKLTQEAITEIRRIFKNHIILKIFEDVGKHEKVPLDLSPNFSDFSEVKHYYYIIGGIIITFLILIIVNFAMCSRKNRKNQSMDLTEIPHLTLTTENFKMSIPRPSISTVHLNKNDDSAFSEYYQRGCSGNKKYSQDFQAFENIEFKSKQSYMNPDDNIKFDEWMPKKRQMHNHSQEKDLLGIDNSAFTVKVVKY